MTIGFIGWRCPRCGTPAPIGRVHDCQIVAIPPADTKAA